MGGHHCRQMVAFMPHQVALGILHLCTLGVGDNKFWTSTETLERGLESE